jgi:spore germination cell wall hydrolase CwlJ-like protein
MATALVTGAQFVSPIFAAQIQGTPEPVTPAPTFTSTPVVQAVDADAAHDDAPDAHDVECMAKVIIHEAGNQPHRGQVAVAQVVRTRMKASGSDSACDVIAKPGQFFNVNAYKPSRQTALWRGAVEIATATLNGEGEEVVPGAMFFHTAGYPMRGRQRLAQIEGHVFYR